jgi:hypothetical protein
VKFLRHLTAVVLVVAAIVGLGMLWAHTSGGGTGIGHLEHAPPREVVLRMQQIKAGVIRAQSGNGVNLSDTGNLIRTCEIEAALATLVIAVSAARLRHRRMRRTAVRGSG